ncbi:flippase-like domain-containing protein [Hymenobacter sp. J193]|uniref:lysylphosphatidylglycerol synthase transmembrane domain-containing protein n=1 Tax=Hymenobacter sp. J193 TaxID=2898429 RepID=UPI002150CA50|nr:lysylphosphatidylglycerol synthase transmembrane domain-containing protein [Hymenobacter sp. J193]MCR5888055.1 flippase-like domain-containing protein [Hymenobacter sp. J193]
MKKLLNILKYVLLLAFSAVLMRYAVRGQDLSLVGRYMREANYFWLGITMMLSALGYFSRAYRWKMQLDATNAKQTATYWDVYHAMMVGYLANMVLPRMGEVIRCSVLRRTSGVPVQVALGSVITERVIDVLVLLCLIGATVLVDFRRFREFVLSLFSDKYDSLARSQQTILVAGGLLLLIGLITLYVLYRNLERLRQLALFNKMERFVRGLLDGVFSIRKLAHPGLFLLHTLFTWLVYYLMDYLAFFAFPETAQLGMAAGLGVLTFGAIGMATPVQGGIGAFHLMVQSTLLVYGISKEAGIAYALVVHGSQTLLVVLMGGISFVASMVKSGRTAQPLAAGNQPG